MSALQYKIEKKAGYFYISKQTTEGGSFVYLGVYGQANQSKIYVYESHEDASAALSKFMEDDQVWVVSPAKDSKKK